MPSATAASFCADALIFAILQAPLSASAKTPAASVAASDLVRARVADLPQEAALGLPRTYLIDPRRRLVARYAREIDLDALHARIKKPLPAAAAR